MIESDNLELKGVIKCPGCGKGKVYAYNDAKGHTSVRCHKCNKTIMVDNETLSALIIPPMRHNEKKKPS